MARILSRLPLLFIAAVLAGLPVRAEEFEYGKRPPDGVFDPMGFLSSHDLRSLSGELSMALLDDKVEVLVVILDDLDGAPAEFVARKFCKAWGSEPARAVVLRVPDRYESPWIVPTGELMDEIPPAEVQRRLREARGVVKAQTEETARLRAAATQAVMMLREWKAQANRQESAAQGMSGKHPEPHRKMMSLVYTYAAVGITALLILALVLIRILLRKPTGRMFPDFQPHPRFGAPYSGGNFAVVDLSSDGNSGGNAESPESEA